MKKLLSLVALLMLTAVSALNAATVRVGFDIDNPEAVKNMNVNFVNVQPSLIAGTNYFEFEVEEGRNVFMYMELTSDYMFESVEASDNFSKPSFGNSVTMFSMYMTASDDGAVWTVKTIALKDARSVHFTLNVDDATKIRVKESKTNLYYTLQNGVNELGMVPDGSNQVVISASSYYDPIYKVELNGTRISGNSYGEYVIVPADGDVVNVTAVIPDMEVPVRFDIPSEAANVISSISVDNVPVTDFNGNELMVQLGKEVFVRLDDTNFNISKVEINGEDYGSVYGSIRFTPMDETTVKIYAASYGELTAYITVDDPANVKVYQGYAYNEKLIELQPGRNAVQLPSKDATVSIWHSDLGRVVSISDGDNEYQPSQYGTLKLSEGMELTITTAAFARDQKMIVWLDSREIFSSFTFSLGSYDFRTELGNVLTTGYNEVLIDPEVDNPATASFYISNPEYKHVYVNDTEIDPAYAGGSYFYLPRLEEGSVVKFFMTCDPEKYETSFDIAEGLDVTVVKDYVTTLSDFTAPHMLLQNTLVNISSPNGEALNVKIDDQTVEADEQGCYSFVALKDATVSVSGKTSGIDTVVSDNATDNVYNLQGIRLDSRDIDSLPAGIYIVNGQKVKVGGR